ncbi:MAG: hypothetical protein FD180_3708 [Planctomycetota bacterium]|nr:MAG: hypothetical protein FD180_3708 [Planctomycetota bacterium]
MRTLLTIALLSSRILADGIPISGQITDAEGKPASGVEFGAEWATRNGKLLPFQRWKPGADGKYSGELHWKSGAMAFLALDAAQTNGALLVVEEKDLKAPMSIDMKLGPLSGVSGSLACPAIGPALGTTSLFVEARPSGARVAWLTQKNDKFAIPLPPGDYEAVAMAFDAKKLRTAFKVEVGGKALDLGKLELAPTEIAQSWGKAPPAFAATAARGVPADLKLATLKGKWVLVVFWSAEADDFTRVVYQNLKGLLERQKAAAGEFEILALYDSSARDWKEYDAKVANLRAGIWGGTDPPFPVLLDSTGETWKAWGIESKSAMALIDPDGNVVRGGNDRVLEEKLNAK